MTEGYIKFDCRLNKKRLEFDLQEIAEMIEIRNQLYQHKLIGTLANGIGFGNISYRERLTNSVVITGSQTGAYQHAIPQHFVRIIDYSISQNLCICEGEFEASSETLTHMAAYQNKNVNCVIHIHDRALWDKYLNFLPTTSISAEFGTPQLAEEIAKLTSQNNKGVIIMGGHQDGILIYDTTPKLAFTQTLYLLNSNQ